MIKGVMQGIKLRIRTPYKDGAEKEYRDELGKLAHALAGVEDFEKLITPSLDRAGWQAAEWERHLLNECLRLGIWRPWFVQWHDLTETAIFMVMKVFPPWEIRQAQALAKKVGEHVVGLNLKRWLLMSPEQFLRESGASSNRDVMAEMRRVLGDRCRRKCK